MTDTKQPIKPINMKERARILKVLSVGTRLEILSLLKKGSMCVNALACRLDISQGAVSQHLRIMREAGLLIDEKDGYFVHYRLDENVLSQWKKIIDQILSPEEGPEDPGSKECKGC
jgi:DNA-binding transcriptional ArsR family regulator